MFCKHICYLFIHLIDLKMCLNKWKTKKNWCCPLARWTRCIWHSEAVSLILTIFWWQFLVFEGKITFYSHCLCSSQCDRAQHSHPAALWIWLSHRLLLLFLTPCPSELSPRGGRGNPGFSSILPGESHGQRSLAGYIQSMGSQRVRDDWATKHSTSFINP